jgi:four helix bundle protein
MSDGPLVTKSFDLALLVVSLCQKLRSEKDFVISHQLLKSGTSVGANISEAQGCQSKKDFRAKMSIAYKEAKETEYWLKILRHSEVYQAIDIEDVYKLLTEILRMLNATMRTTKPD